MVVVVAEDMAVISVVVVSDINIIRMVVVSDISAKVGEVANFITCLVNYPFATIAA